MVSNPVDYANACNQLSVFLALDKDIQLEFPPHSPLGQKAVSGNSTLQLTCTGTTDSHAF